MAEKDPEDAKRLQAVGLLPTEDEGTFLIHLSPVAEAMALEEAAKALGPGARVNRAGIGIESALNRLRDEGPPELPPGSMARCKGGEIPQGHTTKTALAMWTRAELTRLIPNATLAWPRVASDGRPWKANDSMVVQYVIERLRRVENVG
jgi:hypothetical protein